MSGKSWILVGIAMAGLSVVIGAFGAHGLENYLRSLEPAIAAKKLENWRTGAMYQFFHALGIIGVGTIRMFQPRQPQTWLNAAAWLMVLGILLFSWLLYAMTLTNLRLGMIVPLGGLSFIGGWIAFAIGVSKLKLEE